MRVGRVSRQRTNVVDKVPTRAGEGSRALFPMNQLTTRYGAGAPRSGKPAKAGRDACWEHVSVSR